MGKVKGYMTDLLKREFYMDTFHIGNLDDPNKPLAMVAMTPQEGLIPLWPYFAKIRKFILYEIGKDLQCSAFEFLEQPRWVVDTIIEEFEEKARQKLDAVNTAERKAKQDERAAGANRMTIPPMPGYYG